MRLHPKKIVVSVLATINVLVIAAMNLCAYSTYLPPQKYPNWSFLGLAFPAFLAASAAFIAFWLVFKKRYTWLSLFGMLACAPSIRTYCPLNIPSTPPDNAIKVLSYNVFNMGEDGTLPVQDNPIIDYLLESGADIICLQEAARVSLPQVHDTLATKYPYISCETEKKTASVCLSKYPILSREPIDFKSSSNASFAYKILIGGDTVTVINNHLESYKLKAEEKQKYKDIIKRPEDTDIEGNYGELTGKLAAANALRGAQADSIKAYVDRHGGKYVIMCGDFNDCSLSYTHHTLTQTLNDAYTRSGNGPGLSYNRSGMYFRIDNILVSESFKPYAAKVDKSIHASDHYPIMCHLEPVK